MRRQRAAHMRAGNEIATYHHSEPSITEMYLDTSIHTGCRREESAEDHFGCS